MPSPTGTSAGKEQEVRDARRGPDVRRAVLRPAGPNRTSAHAPHRYTRPARPRAPICIPKIAAPVSSGDQRQQPGHHGGHTVRDLPPPRRAPGVTRSRRNIRSRAVAQRKMRRRKRPRHQRRGQSPGIMNAITRASLRALTNHEHQESEGTRSSRTTPSSSGESRFNWARDGARVARIMIGLPR